jgi:hypothetical protein
MENIMLVQMFPASDDQVLVRKVRSEEVYEKEFSVEEDDEGNEVLKGEETDEVLTDDDGEVVTKEKMFDVDSYFDMRAMEFNISDTLKVEFDFQQDEETWDMSIQPYVEVYEIGGNKRVEAAEMPEDWDFSIVEVPDEVRLGDPYNGLCLLLDVPEEEDFEVEKL